MSNNKIVILDGYTENPNDLSWDKIREFGEVTVYDRSSIEESIKRVENCNIIITNKAKVTKEVIDSAKNLIGIFVLATGFDCVDYEYAKKKNIGVYNVPTYGTNNVAEFTFSLILEITKHVGLHNESVKKGDWIKSSDFCYFLKPQIELDGKTLGVIGYGKIGKRVGEIAKAFSMKVVTTSRDKGKIGQVIDGIEYLSLEELLKKSDFVSLHCPLNKDNKEFINLDTLKLMKKSAFLINTARGGLIKEADLRYALDEGIIGGACVDVVSCEPMDSENPLLKAKNIIITPHIAWGTYDARVRIMDTTYENIMGLLNNKEINRVN